MQPDSPNPLKSDAKLGRFFREKLASPMEYLRGLAREAEASDEQLEEPPDSSGTGTEGLLRACGDKTVSSVVRQVGEQLGFAPAVDSPGDDKGSRDPIKLSKERYAIEGEVGVGGMGKILNVYDQDLRRRVAMKVLHAGQRDPRAVERFFEEAQATGQLEHPNITPVYDLGVDNEHGVFFTMKLVRGRNLREVLRDVSIGRLETRRHFTLTRLLQILQQVAMGIRYAHVRGVIHRDLKPENIMVGDFGEVLVMDWGLAKIVDRRSDTDLQEPVFSNRQDSGQHTLDGTISGTPSYMAPEQARGWIDDIDERTDVFGLGAILYEILTYHPPYESGSSREIIAKAGAGQIVPPRIRAPRNAIPVPLEVICLKALSSDREERYQDALTFHEALQVFLDGTLEAARRGEESVGLARQGKEKAREYRRLLEEEQKLRLKSQEELSALRPQDSPVQKSAAWSLEDEASIARQKRIQAFNEATALLHSAINVDPGCTAAKEVLADLYWQRFQEAERAGNTDDEIIYRGLVERYHEGKLATLLEGRGRLSLETDPPGAHVSVHRVVKRERRLFEEKGESCGKTPLKMELPIGHHLLVIKKDGYRDTRYPVFMTRCGRETAKVKLYRDEDIGSDYIYIPAGDFTMGGDPVASGSVSLCRRYVPDLFVAEFPVTFREYCKFLDDVCGNPDDPETQSLFPQTEKEGKCVRRGASGLYEPSSDVIDIESATRERYSEAFEWDLPVFAVDWYSARRYAKWLSGRIHRRVRLLRDAEWEKAARGVARTTYPWSDQFDWSFVKGGLSRSERSQPEPVGVFPCDRSIYGVRDLAGTIIEWCEDWFLENKYRVTRGAGWNSINETAFRAAFRLGTSPTYRSALIGFRVAIDPGRGR